VYIAFVTYATPHIDFCNIQIKQLKHKSEAPKIVENTVFARAATAYLVQNCGGRAAPENFRPWCESHKWGLIEQYKLLKCI